MEDYLQSVKTSVLNLSADDSRVHVVLGNEACDLDSAVSAIIYAFFLHKTKVRSNNNNALIVPLLNIRRSELYMHTDVTHLLKDAGVSLELLSFRDDLDLTSFNSAGRLTLTLVDHNRLSREDSVLESCVIEIIDHHARLPCELGGAETRRCEITLEMVGSCCTLVAEKLLDADTNVLDGQIALLLYGTILLDTVCLNDAAKRVTPKDKSVAEKLRDFLPDVDRHTLFRSLHDAKSDVSGLSVFELLRRDLKCTSNDTMKIAVSTISASLKDFLQRTNAEVDLERFAVGNDCQIVLLMGVQVNPDNMDVQRQLAVYSAVQGYREQIVDLLEAVSTRGPKLGLQSLPSPYATVALYHQGNVAATRKVILPLLHTFLHGDRSLSVSVDVSNSGTVKNGCHDNDHDSLAAESEDVVLLTEPIGNPAVVSQLHVLGIGDPMSHTGSSQSSNQNSCPYTPQNSCTDGGLELDPYARQMLPSFNSREMMEKIESKRGKLRGYSGEDDAGENTFYPFTPKNSFVDGSFEAYVRTAPSFDSGDLLLKVNEKVASMDEPAAVVDDEVTGSITVEVPYVAAGRFIANTRSDSRELDGRHATRDTNSLDKPKCPEAASFSERLEKNGDILDTNGSEMSASSNKTSPFPDEAVVTTTTTTAITIEANNHVSNDEPAEPYSNSNNNEEVMSRSRAESSHSISSLQQADLDLELAANYQTETVDFPHSPRQLKLLTQSAQGLSLEETVPEEEEEEEDDDEAEQRQPEDEDFRAVLSPSSDGVKLKKGTICTDSSFSNDELLLESLELESDTADDFDDGVLELSIDTESDEPIEKPKSSSVLGRCRRALIRQFSTPIDKGKTNSLAKEFSRRMSAIGHLSAITDESNGTTDIDASILDRIRTCLGRDNIRDDYDLHRRLRRVLEPSDVKDVLTNRQLYKQFLDESILDLLERIDRGEVTSSSNDEESSRVSQKSIVTVDRSRLDRSIAERFGDELQIGAVFQGSKSKRREPKPSVRFPPEIARESEIDGLRSVPRGGNAAYFVESFSEDKRKKIIPLSLDISLGFDDSMSSPERIEAQGLNDTFCSEYTLI